MGILAVGWAGDGKRGRQQVPRFARNDRKKSEGARWGGGMRVLHTTHDDRAVMDGAPMLSFGDGLLLFGGWGGSGWGGGGYAGEDVVEGMELVVGHE